MKQTKHILATIAMLLCSLAASAYDFMVDGIYYNIISEEELTVEVSSYSNGYKGKVVIPETVAYNNTSYSVTEIRGYAFEYCNNLTSITIPESVTSIGESAFIYCSSLIAVHISSLEAWCNIDFADVYANPLSYAKNLYLNGGLVTELTIPNSVTAIKNNAFYCCRRLTSITIPEGVTSIGNSAFSYCYNLTSITIPEGVTSIGRGAFDDCGSLTSITLPESVTSIGSCAFFYCSSLTAITLPESVTSIGESAFSGTPWYNNQSDGLIYIGKVLYNYKGTMPANTSIEVKEGTVSISPDAFTYCCSLTSITIPESVMSIGSDAFYNCSNLTSITIPESVTSIGSDAFTYCCSLTSITSYAITPPTLGHFGSFGSVDKSIPVYVPLESVEEYKSATEWKSFTNIIGMETGIEKVDNSELPIDESQLIYDLNGRRMTKPTKGIYIVNGKKVIVK